MIVLALSRADATFWWIAVGVGAVVVAVVVVLLTLLLRLVDDIERGVERVWANAELLAANTATSWQAEAAAAAAQSMRAELEEHRRLLGLP